MKIRNVITHAKHENAYKYYIIWANNEYLVQAVALTPLLTAEIAFRLYSCYAVH